jgi:hypothetical protein
MIEADGWETAYQSPSATDPAVGVEYEFRAPPPWDGYWEPGPIRFVVASVSDDGHWCRDTAGRGWDFSVYGAEGRFGEFGFHRVTR